MNFTNEESLFNECSIPILNTAYAICNTGADRFARDIKMMTGNGVSKLLRILWCLVIPTVLLVSIIKSIVQ